jgi:uncharacterized membrane protein (DUF373 family)
VPGRIANPLRSSARDRVAGAFTVVEDVVYVGLGLLLAGAALVLLASLTLSFSRGLLAGTLPGSVIAVLDQILLILMILELLYTVQLSFREHVLVPEPFVLVALIASVRRILVLAPEIPKVVEQNDAQFRNAMIELAVLTTMTLSLVACLVMLRKRHPQAVAERV